MYYIPGVFPRFWFLIWRRTLLRTILSSWQLVLRVLNNAPWFDEFFLLFLQKNSKIHAKFVRSVNFTKVLKLLSKIANFTSFLLTNCKFKWFHGSFCCLFIFFNIIEAEFIDIFFVSWFLITNLGWKDPRYKHENSSISILKYH